VGFGHKQIPQFFPIDKETHAFSSAASRRKAVFCLFLGCGIFSVERDIWFE
jgi:hypothetical protein